MKNISLGVDKSLCAECGLALRRFIGGMNGVESVDVERGKIVVRFDEAKIPEEDITKIARDSVEKLGYKLED